MKNILLALFVASMFLISCNTSAQSENSDKTETQKTKETYLLLEPENFEKKLNTETNPQLIDVRTASEFNLGSISNAKNLDILNGTLQNQISTLDKSKTVFVFCAMGGRSSKASKLLQESGFTSVIDLKGGYSAWSKFKP